MTALTRAEYWLLETVVLHGTRLALIFAETFKDPGHRGVEFEFNKPWHGLYMPDLLTTLLQMQARGWIIFHENHEESGAEHAIECTEATLRASLQGDRVPRVPSRWLSYGLTPLGGQIWEEFAAPDWSWYMTVFQHNHVGRKPDSIRVTALSRERLETALSLLRLRPVSNTSFQASDYHVPADESELIWGNIAPWQATYWKVFPQAQTVTWPVAESWFEAHQVIEYPLRGPLFDIEIEDRWYCWR